MSPRKKVAIPRLSAGETAETYRRHMNAQYDRAEKAEARVSRLEQALTKIATEPSADMVARGEMVPYAAIARAALGVAETRQEVER